MSFTKDRYAAQWHKVEITSEHVAWEKRMHGHLLTIFHSECGSHWMKWIDKHFRGSVETFTLAKEQLEREAAGEGSAWGAK